MKVLRAVGYPDWSREQTCAECTSALRIYSDDVVAVNYAKDPEDAPEWRYGFTCVICSATCLIVDRPLPSYVREAAERRAREGNTDA